MNARSIAILLRDTLTEWRRNEVSLLASSLAYYAVFSLAPLSVLVIAFVGGFLDETTATEQIIARTRELVGDEGARLVATAIAYARPDANPRQTWRLVFYSVFLLAGATSVFAQIQDALNRIWEVRRPPGKRVFHFIRKRILTFVMVLAIAFLFLGAFFGNFLLVAIVNSLKDFVPPEGYFFFWRLAGALVYFLVATMTFILLYAILPDARIYWRDTLVGAGVTATLFLFGQLGFSWFLGRSDFGSIYGVAGSFAIVIVWVFFAAHVLFLGATFTKVYARYFGSPIVRSTRLIAIARSRPKKRFKRRK